MEISEELAVCRSSFGGDGGILSLLLAGGDAMWSAAVSVSDCEERKKNVAFYSFDWVWKRGFEISSRPACDNEAHEPTGQSATR